jgi:hypothetical protein
MPIRTVLIRPENDAALRRLGIVTGQLAKSRERVDELVDERDGILRDLAGIGFPHVLLAERARIHRSRIGQILDENGRA